MWVSEIHFFFIVIMSSSINIVNFNSNIKIQWHNTNLYFLIFFIEMCAPAYVQPCCCEKQICLHYLSTMSNKQNSLLMWTKWIVETAIDFKYVRYSPFLGAKLYIFYFNMLVYLLINYPMNLYFVFKALFKHSKVIIYIENYVVMNFIYV